METDNKRRRFIQATVVAPLAVGAAGRLHGAPASVQPLSGASAGAERLVLPLANSGLPVAALTDLTKVSVLVESVLTDSSAANSFFSAPRSYFEAHGLDGSDSTLLDGSVAMLVALSAPAVKDALKNRNYTEFFDYMKAAGVFEPRDPSVLQSRIERIISSNIDEIRSAIGAQAETPLTPDQQAEFMAILKSSGTVATEEDLAVLAQVLKGDGGVTIAACSAMAACVVGIALLAVLYVSAAVAATVAILAAITISAAMMTAITVSGSQQPQLRSAPFTGQFMKLDPAAVRNLQRSYRLAQITQDGELQLHALREAIREEVEAVLVSLSNLKLIEVSPGGMPLAIEAVTHYAYKAAGVPTSNAH